MNTQSCVESLLRLLTWIRDRGPAGLVCVYGLIIGFLIFSASLELGIGTDDIAMLKVFSYDEPHAIELLLLNLKNRDLDPRGFYNYGYLYHTVAYAIVSIYRAIGFDVGSTQLLAFVTRGLSLVFYIFLLIGFERTLRAHSQALSTRLAFTALVAAMPTLYRWGHFTHPDALQLFLAIAVVVSLGGALSVRRAFVAALIAGLSFGTKAPGFFLLFLIGLTYLFDIVALRKTDKLRARGFRLLGVGLVVLIGFTISWLGTNPYILKHPRLFLEDFRYERVHVAVGHGRIENTPAFFWTERLAKELSTPGIWIVVAGVALLLSIVVMKVAKAIRNEANAATRAPFSIKQPALCFGVAVYTTVYMLLILFEIDLKQARYLLPVLPFIVWLSAVGFASFFRQWQAISFLIIPICILCPTLEQAKKTCYTSAASLKRIDDERIAVGRWMQVRYPSDTKVLAERYSYIPPNSVDVTYLDRSIDAGLVEQFKPDVLVITRKQSGRFVWKQKRTKFRQRRFKKGAYSKADHFHDFFIQIFSPDSKWRVVKENRGVVVLESRDLRLEKCRD